MPRTIKLYESTITQFNFTFVLSEKLYPYVPYRRSVLERYVYCGLSEGSPNSAHLDNRSEVGARIEASTVGLTSVYCHKLQLGS